MIKGGTVIGGCGEQSQGAHNCARQQLKAATPGSSPKAPAPHLLFWLMILLLSEVLAARISCSRSSIDTGMAELVRICGGQA